MKKVSVNYLYNVIYQILIILMPLITSPYAARVLGPEAIGISSYSGANAKYFILLVGLGFNFYGQRLVSLAKNSSERNKIFVGIVASKLVVGVVVFIAYALLFLCRDVEYREVYFAQSLAIFASIIDITWFYAGQEKFKQIVIRNTITRLIFIFGLFYFVKSESDLISYVLVLVGGTFLGNIVMWVGVLGKVSWTPISIRDIYLVFRKSLIYVIPTIALAVNVTINQTILGRFSGATEVGYFSQSFNIVNVLLTLVTSLGTVMLPRMTKMINEKSKVDDAKRMITGSFKVMTILAIPIMVALMIVSHRFSIFFYGPSFARIGQLMLVESFSILFIAWNNVIGLQYLMAANRIKEYSFSIAGGGIITLAAGLLLIPALGSTGAMMNIVLSEAMVVLIQVIMTRNDLNYRQMFNDFHKLVLSGALMFVAAITINSRLEINNDFLYLSFNALMAISFYMFFLIIFNPSVLKNKNVLLSAIRNKG